MTKESFPSIVPQNGCYKFQIKKFDDPEFKITLTAKENEDLDTIALEHLGYFVVPAADAE